jgi:hypothetical protein
VAIVFFSGIAAYIPLKAGVNRTISVFAEYPEMWVPFIMLMGVISLFLRMALPPRTSLARLEIWHDRLRLTPDRIQRFIGDPPVEKIIPSQSKEVVLFHSSALGLTSGYSIIIRDGSDVEHTLKSTCLNSLNLPQSLRLADTISGTTGLPVRLAVKMLTDDGRFQEVPWKAAPLKGKAQIIVAWLGAVLPILTGCLVGYFALLPAMAFVIGLTVWSGWILACTIVVRKSPQGKKLAFMYMLTTVFTFSAVYWVSAVLVAFLLRTRK